MNVVAIIQARLTSKRFPKKVLAEFANGKSVLQTVIDRVKMAKRLHHVVVASPHPIQFTGASKYVYTVSENDVLSRYYNCALEYKADVIVRITADCPLINPQLIDLAINMFYEMNIPYLILAPVSGFDVEVFSFRMLQEAHENAKDEYDREHVTPYMKRVSDLSVDTVEMLEKARKYYADMRYSS